MLPENQLGQSFRQSLLEAKGCFIQKRLLGGAALFCRGGGSFAKRSGAGAGEF